MRKYILTKGWIDRDEFGGDEDDDDEDEDDELHPGLLRMKKED